MIKLSVKRELAVSLSKPLVSSELKLASQNIFLKIVCAILGENKEQFNLLNMKYNQTMS